MQSCWWRERFSQTTATAFCPTIHQGVRGCMPTRHDDKYACQPSTVRFWQLGISTAQINFQSQTLRKDLKFTAPDSQEALIFTGGRQKEKSSRQAQFVILQRSKQFFPSRIFLSKCCDPLKSSIGQKVSAWKLEKKKFAVCFFTKNDYCNHLEFSASCGGFAQNMFIERTRRRLGGFRVVKFRTLQKTSQILLSWCFLLYCKHGISKKKTSVVWSRNTDTSAIKKGKVKHLLVLNNMEVGKCSWRPGSETCCSI